MEKSTEEVIREMAVRARAAAAGLRRLDTAAKNAALLAVADALESGRAPIMAANATMVRLLKGCEFVRNSIA